jgi:hypothetical protein
VAKTPRRDVDNADGERDTISRSESFLLGR